MKTHLSVILLIITFLQGIVFAQESSYEKYNILWISCEDIGPVLGCYGNTGISTPNIDRLASEGILFENAYSTSGVCAPSRFSVITGMYPARVGAQNMRTGNHWGYKEPEKESYLSYKQVRDKEGNNVPEYSVVPPDFVKCFTEYLRERGYYTTNNPKCDYQFNCPITAWDEVGGSATYKNRPVGMPFFSVFNLGVTHESQLWKKANDPLLADTSIIRIPDYYPDIEVVRSGVGRKYSNIMELDTQVEEILDELEREGLLDNTIIFFWSDHGGPLLRQKRAVGNSGLHVPLIVRFPDKRKAGQRNKNIVSLMDLGPTVLSLAGIEPPSYMDGIPFLGAFKDSTAHRYAFGNADRFDEYTGMSRSVIDGRYVYIRNFMTHLPYTYRLKYREQVEMNKALIEMNERGELIGDAAYIFMDYHPREELYDLKNDPYEVRNLAGNTEYSDKLIELRKALAGWQLEIGDKGFIPESELINMMWPGYKQPITEPVVFKLLGDSTLVLNSSTKGASIAYQINPGPGDKWMLYYEPLRLEKGQSIKARAVRLGYRTSEPSSYDYK